MTGKGEAVSPLKNQSTGETSLSTDRKERKPYEPPRLTKRGSVIDLTRGGGSVIDDGLGTLEGHL
jgi:hypothetical protein